MDPGRPDDHQERIATVQEDVENDLDEILSPRNSNESKTAALRRLEVLIGGACVKSASQTLGDLQELMRLQDGFECNIPCRLLPWISVASAKLELLAGSSKPGVDDSDSIKNEHFFTVKEIAAQIVLSLSIIQGITLNHARSKKWLGRAKSLEIFVDLLLASRHVSTSLPSSAGSLKSGSSPSLTSTILDTILCILVDSTPALRAFEQSNGVQAIVKILKRAGSPREVRMKCLEFLYFYLLDETKPSPPTASLTETPPDSAPTVPNTPLQSRSSYGSSHFPPTIPNTPRESVPSRGSSRSLLRGASNASISSSTSSTSSTGQPSTASRSKAKKPYLSGLATPNRPSPKPRSDYGSSTFSFPTSSYSGPSVVSEGASEKGYITESSQSSRSSSKTIDATETQERKDSSLRSVSSSSAQSFASTSSTTSAASGISSLSSNSSTTAPSSAECSPKKNSNTLPKLPPLPTIPSASLLKTPPGSPEMELRGILPIRNAREPKTPSASRTSILHGTPSGPPKTPASSKVVSVLSKVPPSKRKPLFPSASGEQSHTLMMLNRDVDFVPQSPQKMQGFGKIDLFSIGSTSATSSPGLGANIGVGTVTGLGGKRTRTHSRTRSAFALGASSTRTSSRTSSRERGHTRARSVGRRDSEMGIGGDASSVGLPKEGEVILPIKDVGTRDRKEVKARTTEEKKELLGTMLGNVDALVEGVRKAGIWGLG